MASAADNNDDLRAQLLARDRAQQALAEKGDDDNEPQMVPLQGVTVRFVNMDCQVRFGHHANGPLCIALYENATDPDHELYTMATMNLPDQVSTFYLNPDYTHNTPVQVDSRLDKDEVMIKDYSENIGLPEALMKAGIIGPCLREAPYPVHRLLLKPSGF